jgi:hypothetical protein
VSTPDPVNRLQSGVKFNVIPETLQSPFKDHFSAYYKGLVRGEPGGYVIHPEYTSPTLMKKPVFKKQIDDMGHATLGSVNNLLVKTCLTGRKPSQNSVSANNK